MNSKIYFIQKKHKIKMKHNSISNPIKKRVLISNLRNKSIKIN
jgi:hypothetical protein